MKDKFMVMSGTKELVTSASLDGATSYARQKAKEHPRSVFEVFKLVAEVKADVCEPTVVMKE